MTAKYFSQSPRGFSNEVTVYAVDQREAQDWAAWFRAAYRCEEPDGQPLNSITRKHAARLLQRDGVLLAIDHLEDEWLIAEGLANSLNTQSVASACRGALALRTDWEKEQAFAQDMDLAHPEFATAR